MYFQWSLRIDSPLTPIGPLWHALHVRTDANPVHSRGSAWRLPGA